MNLSPARYPLPLKQVQIEDPFWKPYTQLVTRQIIPYQYQVLQDALPDVPESHCIENFRIAAGESEGQFRGWVFQDTDLAKWLEAVAYSLSYEKNETLEQTADGAIDLIARAQRPDGYLDTYFIIKEPEGKFTNLREGHELYTAGHFMEAAVAYYEVTGKDRLLKIMGLMPSVWRHCSVMRRENSSLFMLLTSSACWSESIHFPIIRRSKVLFGFWRGENFLYVIKLTQFGE